MDKVLAATVMTVGSAFVVGLVLAFLGSIKLNLARHLDMGDRSNRAVASLFALLNLSLLPSMLVSGILIDSVGVRWVLLGGSVLTATAVGTLSQLPSYGRAMMAVLLAGIGSAALGTACIVLMPYAFLSSDPRELVVHKINLGHVFIALGALLTPALSDVLFRTLQFRRTIMVLGALCLVPAGMCLVPALAQELPASANLGPDKIVDDVLTHLLPLVMAGLVFFCYAPLEGAVSVWTTTYLTETGDGEGKAAWILTGFWTTFLMSRLLWAYLMFLDPKHDIWPWVLVAFSLTTALVLGNQASTGNRTTARLGLLLLGFFLGPIFPTLLGLLLEAIDPQFRGTTYGLFFAFGSVGSLMLAPFVGRHPKGQAAHVFRVPLILALVMTLMAVGFVLVGK